MNGGWHGVDLDGTLAHYDHWRGIDNIGEPIALMANRVTAWLAAGEGVKIMTARVSQMFSSDPDEFAESVHAKEFIQEWTLKHFGVKIPVTCAKDFQMIDLWDDRAVQIEINTGRTIFIQGQSLYGPCMPSCTTCGAIMNAVCPGCGKALEAANG